MLLRIALILNLISVSIFAETLVGTWQLVNKERPFNFASTVGYEMTFKFNSDGTLELLQKSHNIMNSTRRYELKNGNKLVVVLKNKDTGALHNFALGTLSSQTLTLVSVKNNCYRVYENQPNNNVFTMCKI